MSVVVALFLLAPLVVIPLGFRLLDIAVSGSRPPTLVLNVDLLAAGILVVAFLLPAGPLAAVLALPWLVVTAGTALAAGLRLLQDPNRFRPNLRHATDAAVAFLAIGAVFAVIDRLGARPLDLSPAIILLTAVHFHYAGFVLPLAGALAQRRRPSRWLEIALGAVVVGIPITALGFIGVPFANWIGAMLTAFGGLGIGLTTVLIARILLRGPAVGPAAGLALVAGVSLLISMPMAAIYATGTLLGTAWLDLDTMARVHGTPNALGFALPVMVAWTLDRRARNPAPPSLRPARDPRRLGLGAAAIIAGYAVVVAAISAGLVGDLVSDEFGPADVVPRPLLLGGLFLIPAALAAVGAIRRSRPILVAAGVLCLAQSFIAFSGVTIPFVVPGFLLLAIGAQGPGVKVSGRAAIGGIAAIVLGLAAWVSLLGLTETRCWVARTAADGSVVYTQIPVSDTLSVGVDEVASGCDGGALTIQGAALAAALGIGAMGLAALATTRPPAIRPPREEVA